ncbi:MULTISPECIES: hypothetical protein [Thalassobaculum]|uniref:Uncharacterized protein n=1 Tax=Thalassobaculum litoreum DSM 18839 TaxID=1123362 RepID=A0A8G2BGD3_9PROT|nr:MULTISPECIES: hypothetical protein [Thalassobaculum]SDF24566.1 hypothetical protein SAMN05660686_00723 [Thalassobaculum litoreum DSM 18839]
MARAPGKTDRLDNSTRRSLTVLADATAEVVGRNDVYEAIAKVAEEGGGGDYETARDKFDHMNVDDRARIRSQAIETLEGSEKHQDKDAPAKAEEPEQLDWAKQMMGNFPKLSEGLDGDKGEK